MVRVITERGLPIKWEQLGLNRNKNTHRRVVYLHGLAPYKTLENEVTTDEGDRMKVDYVTYSPSLSNALESLVTRCFLVKSKGTVDGFAEVPVPRSKTIYNQLDYLADFLAGLLGMIQPFSYEQYVEGTPVHRRKCYEKALENIYRVHHDPRWESSIKGFVKFQRESGSEPRAINPPMEEEIIIKGCYIKAAEHGNDQYTLFTAIDKMWQEHHDVTHPVCSKGLNNFEWGEVFLSKWNRFADPVFVSLDCSRYSQHTGLQPLRYFSKFLEKLMPGAYEVTKPRKTICTSLVRDDDGAQWKVIAKLPVMLCDGSPETAGAAHFIMNIIMAHILPKIKIEPADCGDDFGFVCEREDVPDLNVLTAEMLDYGYTLKVETTIPVDIFNELEFCRMRPCIVAGRCRMIRPPDAMLKDTVLLCRLEEVPDRLFAVGMGGCHINYGVPVYHNLYRCMVRLSGVTDFKRKHLSFVYASNYMYYEVLSKGQDPTKTDAVEYTADDRLEFYKTTGILPCVQKIYEEHFDNYAFGQDVDLLPAMWPGV